MAGIRIPISETLCSVLRSGVESGELSIPRSLLGNLTSHSPQTTRKAAKELLEMVDSHRGPLLSLFGEFETEKIAAYLALDTSEGASEGAPPVPNEWHLLAQTLSSQTPDDLMLYTLPSIPDSRILPASSDKLTAYLNRFRFHDITANPERAREFKTVVGIQPTSVLGNWTAQNARAGAVASVLRLYRYLVEHHLRNSEKTPDLLDLFRLIFNQDGASLFTSHDPEDPNTLLIQLPDILMDLRIGDINLPHAMDLLKNQVDLEEVRASLRGVHEKTSTIQTLEEYRRGRLTLDHAKSDTRETLKLVFGDQGFAFLLLSPLHFFVPILTPSGQEIPPIWGATRYRLKLQFTPNALSQFQGARHAIDLDGFPFHQLRMASNPFERLLTELDTRLSWAEELLGSSKKLISVGLNLRSLNGLREELRDLQKGHQDHAKLFAQTVENPTLVAVNTPQKIEAFYKRLLLLARTLKEGLPSETDLPLATETWHLSILSLPDKPAHAVFKDPSGLLIPDHGFELLWTIAFQGAVEEDKKRERFKNLLRLHLYFQLRKFEDKEVNLGDLEWIAQELFPDLQTEELNPLLNLYRRFLNQAKRFKSNPLDPPRKDIQAVFSMLDQHRTFLWDGTPKNKAKILKEFILQRSGLSSTQVEMIQEILNTYQSLNTDSKEVFDLAKLEQAIRTSTSLYGEPLLMEKGFLYEFFKTIGLKTPVEETRAKARKTVLDQAVSLDPAYILQDGSVLSSQGILEEVAHLFVQGEPPLKGLEGYLISLARRVSKKIDGGRDDIHKNSLSDESQKILEQRHLTQKHEGQERYLTIAHAFLNQLQYSLRSEKREIRTSPLMTGDVMAVMEKLIQRQLTHAGEFSFEEIFKDILSKRGVPVDQWGAIRAKVLEMLALRKKDFGKSLSRLRMDFEIFLKDFSSTMPDRLWQGLVELEIVQGKEADFWKTKFIECLLKEGDGETLHELKNGWEQEVSKATLVKPVDADPATTTGAPPEKASKTRIPETPSSLVEEALAVPPIPHFEPVAPRPQRLDSLISPLILDSVPGLLEDLREYEEELRQDPKLPLALYFDETGLIRLAAITRDLETVESEAEIILKNKNGILSLGSHRAIFIIMMTDPDLGSEVIGRFRKMIETLSNDPESPLGRSYQSILTVHSMTKKQIAFGTLFQFYLGKTGLQATEAKLTAQLARGVSRGEFEQSLRLVNTDYHLGPFGVGSFKRADNFLMSCQDGKEVLIGISAVFKQLNYLLTVQETLPGEWITPFRTALIRWDRLGGENNAEALFQAAVTLRPHLDKVQMAREQRRIALQYEHDSDPFWAEFYHRLPELEELMLFQSVAAPVFIETICKAKKLSLPDMEPRKKRVLECLLSHDGKPDISLGLAAFTLTFSDETLSLLTERWNLEEPDSSKRWSQFERIALEVYLHRRERILDTHRQSLETEGMPEFAKLFDSPTQSVEQIPDTIGVLPQTLDSLVSPLILDSVPGLVDSLAMCDEALIKNPKLRLTLYLDAAGFIRLAPMTREPQMADDKTTGTLRVFGAGSGPEIVKRFRGIMAILGRDPESPLGRTYQKILSAEFIELNTTKDKILDPFYLGRKPTHVTETRLEKQLAQEVSRETFNHFLCNINESYYLGRQGFETLVLWVENADERPLPYHLKNSLCKLLNQISYLLFVPIQKTLPREIVTSFRKALMARHNLGEEGSMRAFLRAGEPLQADLYRIQLAGALGLIDSLGKHDPDPFWAKLHHSLPELEELVVHQGMSAQTMIEDISKELISSNLDLKEKRFWEFLSAHDNIRNLSLLSSSALYLIHVLSNLEDLEEQALSLLAKEWNLEEPDRFKRWAQFERILLGFYLENRESLLYSLRKALQNPDQNPPMVWVPHSSYQPDASDSKETTTGEIPDKDKP